MARKTFNFKTIAIDVAFTLVCIGLIGASLFPFLPTSASEYGQTMPDGKSVKFVHGGAGEWWVQVQVLGNGGAEAKSVDVRSSNGTWAPLTKQTWTEDGSWWAASTHAPPGSDVKFRITTPTVTEFESCWFSHPAGVERCD